MPVCTTKLVGDCASAEGADGTEVSKKYTLLIKYVTRSCSEYVIPASCVSVSRGNGSNGEKDGRADVPLNTLIQGRCTYFEELCLPLNRNGNCTAIDVAQMLRS